MKTKVTLFFVVLFMLLFASTAYADSYTSATGTVIIDTAWAGDLQTRVEALIAPDTAADIQSLTITAGNVTQVDASYIDSQMTSLKRLSVSGAAVFSTIPQNFFYYDPVIEYIEIPVDFTRRFFADDCASLTTISLPLATQIRSDSIRGNPLLTAISAPNMIELGLDSIVGNDSLAALSFPLLEACYVGSLRDNDALTSVSMPSAVYFEGAQFRNSGALTSLSLPSLEYLGPYAIAGCPNLTSLSLPEVTYVGDDALRNNDSLTSISLPKAFDFGVRSLSGNTSLTSVSLPAAAVFDIRVFQNNDSLTSAYIPYLNEMGDFAFNGVPNAITMQLDSTPPTTVGWTTFAAYNPAAMGAIVRVPINQVDDYDAADGVDGDGMWYGWRIVGIVPSEPSVNPWTGDNSVYIPWFVWPAALCALSAVYFILRKKQQV